MKKLRVTIPESKVGMWFWLIGCTMCWQTYCVNKQVADSACSSTAYLGGVKANYGTIGVTSSVLRGNCTGMLAADNRVDTLLKWAQDAGKVTGVVTTTRITHASPAGNYAHTAERDYESDADVLEKNANPEECVDIARQLVHSEPGKNIKVSLTFLLCMNKIFML